MTILINTTALSKALMAFKRSIDVTAQYIQDPQTNKDLKETLRAGVIQHFEFCFELSWKLLKRKLEMDAMNPAYIDGLSYKELIRECAEKQLITDVQAWFLYRKQRNITSHTYHNELAESVYKTALDFYVEAVKLLQNLT